MVKQIESYLKEGSISWIKGITDRILFMEERISQLEGRADKSLFIEYSWHPTGATSTQNGCC
eukprot:2395920-Ditylum_brightwellii.AAC.1